MSTICCMLHLFGKRLGQKGSTLYTGWFCACTAGATARTPKQEIAITAAQVVVHLALSIGNFFSFSVELSVVSVAFLCVLCVKFLKAQHRGHRGSQRTTEKSSPNRALTRVDAAGLFRHHFSGQIFGRVCRYPLRQCRYFLSSPWRSHRSNGTDPPYGRCRRSSPPACPLCGHGSRFYRSCRL